MLGDVEEVTVGVHAATLGIGGLRRALGGFGKAISDDMLAQFIGILDSDAEMVEPGRAPLPGGPEAALS